MMKRCPRGLDSKRQGIPWKFLAHRKTPYSVSLAFEVPTGYSFKDLVQETDAMMASLGRYVEIKNHAGVVVVDVILQEYPETIAADLDIRNPSPRHVMIGLDRGMNPVYHSFKVPHLMIGGMSGYGKTDLVRWILYQLIKSHTPDQLSIDIIDGKGFSFLPFRDIPHIRRIVRDIPGAVSVLKDAKSLMDQRSDIVWSGGERGEASRFRWHIVIVDEAAQISPGQIRDKELKKQAAIADSYAASISCVGREAQVGLLYCTQRPDVSVINPQVKANMEASICFRTKTVSNSEIIIDRPGAEKLPAGKPGRVIYAASEDKVVQVPYVGDDDRWNEILDPFRVVRVPDEVDGSSEDYTGFLE